MAHLPLQTFEVIPLADGTIVVNVFVPTMVTGPNGPVNTGRVLVAVWSYANVKAMTNALAAAIAAPPIPIP